MSLALSEQKPSFADWTRERIFTYPFLAPFLALVAKNRLVISQREVDFAERHYYAGPWPWWRSCDGGFPDHGDRAEQHLWLCHSPRQAPCEDGCDQQADPQRLKEYLMTHESYPSHLIPYM